MRADLHVHSVYSDGAYTPEELASRAKAGGVDLVAVTDHDNFDGDKEKKEAFSAVGIECVSGIELSAYLGTLKVHMTGYGYDAQSELVKKYQKERVERSYERMYDTLFRFKKYRSVALSEEEIFAQQVVQGSPVHTMHIVKALLARGYYQDVFACLKDCFSAKSDTCSFVGRPSPEEAVELLHSLGGIACIAHPGRIDLPLKEKESLIRRLKDVGADGIECDYTTHTAVETGYFKHLADELELFQTGGSDFHRDGRRRIGYPPFEPSTALLSVLRKGK